MKTTKAIFLTAFTVLLNACSSNSYREPNECITGYGLQLDYNKWIAVNLTGDKLFADEMITNDDGEQFIGNRLSWQSQVSCCVNGFYRIGNGRSYTIVANTLTNDGCLQQLGPYKKVGMFYEDITPATKEGEGIGYINRNGDVVFWLDKVLGKKGSEAYNFMGGLSVVGTPITDDGIMIYGAIDTEGNIVLPFDYYKIEYAGSGLWYVENVAKNSNKKYNDWEADIIDRSGNVIISFPRAAYDKGTFSYDNGNHGPHQFAFSGDYGLLYALYDNNWKIIDRSGKILTENTPGITPTGKHRYGNFVFKDEESGKYGIMDQNGETKIDAKFESIAWLGDELFCANDGNEYSIYYYSGDLKYRWSSTHIPILCGNSHLFEMKQGVVMFYHIDDIINEKQIATGRYGDISYYDNLLLEAIPSDTEEIWMPEIKKDNITPDTNDTPKAKKITDKTIADVIGAVKQVIYYENGYKTKIFIFDENGHLTQMGDLKLTPDNSARDGEGRLISITLKEQDPFGDTVTSTITYEYDNNSGKLKSESYDSDYTVWSLTYTRDDIGQVIGNVIETSDGDQNKNTYSYSDYDTNQNWTKLISEDSYGNKNIITRKITYY